MRLLLIGPPGSGKGTQATEISRHYDIPHISSGDLLRRHIADQTPLGRQIAPLVADGLLVPDSVVMDILRKPVETASRQAGGYVLDGFPRTIGQAEAAYLVAKDIGAWVQVALYLDVPRDTVIERMLARHHTDGRPDDTPDVIVHRQDDFEKLTTPLLSYYANREILIRIDGTRPIAEVTTAAIAALDEVRPRLS